jgi:hypothetical protein
MDEAASAADEGEEEEAVLPLAAIAAYRQLQVDLNLAASAHTMSQDTPLSWLIETLTEELWNEEQFQGGDISIHLVPGLQTV